MKIEKLLEFDKLFEEQILSTSESLLKKSIDCCEDEILTITKTLRSIIVYLCDCKSGEAGKTDEQIGTRIWLHQIYNQGMHETERLLFEGQYFKAAACMKQEVEILTRIKLTKKGQLPNGKTPNVSNAPDKMGKAYGILNDIGHVSKPEYYKLLESKKSESVNWVSPFPAFSKSMFKDSFYVYLWVLLEMTRESIMLFCEMFPEDDKNFCIVMKHFSKVQGILKNFGFTFK